MKALSKSQLGKGGILVATTTLLLAQVACTYKKTVEDTPTPCNIPSTVSYQTDVYPVLKKNCRDSCHNDATASSYANFSMDHFDQVYHYCTTAPQGNTTPWLLGNIKHLQLPGYANMPVGASQLSDCDIALIEAWITKGAPNN